MGNNSNLDNPNYLGKEYDEYLAKLSSEIGKCAAANYCSGNTYYTRGEEFTSSDGKKYCNEECHKKFKERTNQQLV